MPDKIIEDIELCFSDFKTNASLELKDPDYNELTELFGEKNYFYKIFKICKSMTSLVKHLKDIPLVLNSFSFSIPENDNNNNGEIE